MQRISDASHSLFNVANGAAMIPLHRAGLAAWLGNPLTGWQLLLTTTGRTSGLPRHAPLGYLVAEGAAWVMAGYGPATHWYRNLLADPHVEVLMPGRGAFGATAEEVTDPAARARIIPALVRSMALPGSLVGTVPATASDERLVELTASIPLVALRPFGWRLAPGPDDPGGLAWIPRQVAVTVAMIVGLRAIGGLVGLGRRLPLRPCCGPGRRGRTG